MSDVTEAKSPIQPTLNTESLCPLFCARPLDTFIRQESTNEPAFDHEGSSSLLRHR